MIAVIDCGIGNLGSVRRAITELGGEAAIVIDSQDLKKADRIVLPGVGNFTEAMSQLKSGGWVDEIRTEVREGKSILGICLGMQLLASIGEEGGRTAGLDLIPGEIVKLDTVGCKERIPHVGWNSLEYTSTFEVELFNGIPAGTDFYFVHSYGFKPENPQDCIATTTYGIQITAAVRRGSVWGTQFHPEKSSQAGFRLLKNFLELPAC